jgi:hypothetical protein
MTASTSACPWDTAADRPDQLGRHRPSNARRAAIQQRQLAARRHAASWTRPRPARHGRRVPTGENAVTGLPWSPATDGLRNITGRVNADGTATIYAVTSTVSGNGDQGADPNKVVAIDDQLSASTLPAGESFRTIDSAGFGEALRGVASAP